jgi:hypothetical protein
MLIPPYTNLTRTDTPWESSPEFTSDLQAEPDAVEPAAETAADATHGEGEALQYSHFVLC